MKLPVLLLCMYVIMPIAYSQQKLRLDPAEAVGGTVSQYLDTVEYITFEQTPKSIFGQINQLEITDKYYVILDWDTKCVLIFTKAGRFHAKIEGQKLNPQHPDFYNFNLDKTTGILEIPYYEDLYYFDLDGKMIRHEKTSLAANLGLKVKLGGDYNGYYRFEPSMPISAAHDSVGYRLTVTQGKTIIGKYLSYKIGLRYYDSFGSQMHSDFYPIPGNDSSTYFVREFDLSVYLITPHTFGQAYQFVFPAGLGLPLNFVSDTSYESKRMKYLNANRNHVYKIGNFYKQGDYLFFKTILNNYTSPSYLYSLSSQKLILIDKIVSDSSSYFLPLTDAEIGGTDFLNGGIIQFDGDYLYATYASLGLFFQYEVTKNKHPHYPPRLLSYFKNEKNQKGNPVLVRFKFKQGL